jgi:hypothetical protein
MSTVNEFILPDRLTYLAGTPRITKPLICQETKGAETASELQLWKIASEEAKFHGTALVEFAIFALFLFIAAVAVYDSFSELNDGLRADAITQFAIQVQAAMGHPS